MPNTWAPAFNNPLLVPSGSGYVNSAANSKPTGKYPNRGKRRRKKRLTIFPSMTWGFFVGWQSSKCFHGLLFLGNWHDAIRSDYEAEKFVFPPIEKSPFQLSVPKTSVTNLSLQILATLKSDRQQICVLYSAWTCRRTFRSLLGCKQQELSPCCEMNCTK